MNRILNFFYFFIIFINLSESFRPIGVILGLTSSFISTLTLLFNFIFIFINFRSFKLLIKNNLFLIWTNIIITFPVILTIFSFFLGYISIDGLMYYISYMLLFGTLFIGMVIMMLKFDLKKIKFLFYLAIGTTILGFVINILNYNFIRKILEFSASPYANQTSLFRMLSFFAHANVAAMSIICYFIVLLNIDNSNNKSFKYILGCILLMLILIFITGSRTSLMLGVIFTILYYGKVLKKTILIKQKIKKSTIVSYIIILPLFLVIINYGNSKILDGILELNIFERFSLFDKVVSGGDVKDESLSLRLAIISDYLEYIVANPVFGYGPEFVRAKIGHEFKNVSQNAFIELSIYHGVFYGFYYLFGLIKSYYLFNKKLSNKHVINGGKIFFLFLFLLSFSVNNIVWYRSIVITLGFFIGIYVKFSLSKIYKF